MATATKTETTATETTATTATASNAESMPSFVNLKKKVKSKHRTHKSRQSLPTVAELEGYDYDNSCEAIRLFGELPKTARTIVRKAVGLDSTELKPSRVVRRMLADGFVTDYKSEVMQSIKNRKRRIEIAYMVDGTIERDEYMERLSDTEELENNLLELTDYLNRFAHALAYMLVSRRSVVRLIDGSHVDLHHRLTQSFACDAKLSESVILVNKIG